ncbi:hypothetical protein [Roseiconus lacunae]|uniref:hypothetical protein n=1 Tax=Roseiconus lacunae TaxID=2605694 RepID=UPI001E627956|nr:hypothetical protein [Roseiconus lacunae]MCD0459571.1 hypothetical protein [Roseiconus lacunae]
MDMPKHLKHFKLLSITDAFREAVNSMRESLNLPTINRFMNERLVYSFLAFRSRQNRGAGINEISRETRLHKATINATLQNLTRLVQQDGGKWVSQEPSTGQFLPLPNPRAIKHWSDRYCYINYYQPAAKAKLRGKRFGVSHAIVLSTVASFAKQTNPNSRLSIQLVCKLTELNSKTVSSVFSDLRSAEIIEYGSGGVRFQLAEHHWSLFQQKTPGTATQEQISLPEASKDHYSFRGDAFDTCRKLCEPLFAQSYAEKSISLSQKLRMSENEFEDALRATKALNDKNIKSGKCSYPNLGKFFVNRLSQRWEEQRRIESEAAQQRARQAYLQSDEYKQKQKAEAEKARANPTHSLHTVDAESITDRVQLDSDHFRNLQFAKDLLRKVHLHCKAYFSKQDLSTQKQVNETLVLREIIVGQALQSLNQYFESENKASCRELEEAIDAVASKVKGLGPVFSRNENPN